MPSSERSPTLFFSVGEPSGDLHGANLIRALQQRSPGLRCEGYGGPHMADAGCDVRFNLCNFPIMGLSGVFSNLPQILKLLRDANRHFRENRPDGVVLIDYPGFNWWIARWARLNGIPVFWFVPPQIWSWATWRVEKMRRSVDHILCSLPFEREWYGQRGIDAPYLGHPYFDALAQQRLNGDFIAQQRAKGGRVIALLPGSRGFEVHMNFETQLRAAARIHETHPNVRFLVAGFKQQHAERMVQEARKILGSNGVASGDFDTGYHGGWPLPIEICVGRTPEILSLAHIAVAVSGSVSLELLYHRVPTVTIYRVGFILWAAAKLLHKVRFMSLVNLLADRELFPEFGSMRDQFEDVAAAALHWLNNPTEHERVCGELNTLRERVFVPGAPRTAEYILSHLPGIDQAKRLAA